MNAILTTPLATLAKASAMINKGNGALLAVTGALGLFYPLTHPGIDTFSSLLVAVYVGGFGALMLKYEFAPGADMIGDFGFMYTYLGRAAFLLLAANLSWTCDPLGWLCALATNANALLSAYVMWAHPTFTSGQASATAIGGFEGEAGGEMLYTGTSSSFDPGSFDPASVAARDRAVSGPRSGRRY